MGSALEFLRGQRPSHDTQELYGVKISILREKNDSKTLYIGYKRAS